MTDQFDVVLTNRFVPGKTEDEVKSALSELFKVPVAKIERMLAANQFIIKRNVDHATAMKYQGRLRQVGVLSLIKPTDMPLPEPKTQMKTRATEPTSGQKSETSTVAREPEAQLTTALGIGDALPPKPQPPVIHIPDFQLDPPGTELLKGVSKPVPPPPPKTDHLSLAPIGERLGPENKQPERHIDLGHLTLAPEGTRLSEPRHTKTAEIDTSKLSVKDN